MEVNTLREKYPNFIYNDFSIKENNEKIIIEFYFEIENLSKFTPKIEILKKNFKFKSIESEVVKNIVFNIGMIEAISYFKATCSPQFFIKCGNLSVNQKNFYKKLYYLGLGEFRYRNNIDIKEENFVNFIFEGKETRAFDLKTSLDNQNSDGIIIPIGGGKDSNVTLDLLKDYKDKSLCFVIGSKKVSMECAKVAGFSNDEIIEVNRVIDKNLLDLNGKGYLNGHTPFSAIVAIISYLCAYLLGKKYIALSNEDSANESNIDGENINHQYSKTIEFENDFRNFAKENLKCDVEYFSLLRPISEIQIAMLFSRLTKYHNIFKSCNVGSKKEPWVWCCNCPKCLFVFSILSPFLYKEKLTNIFKEDLFEKKDLLDTFIDLCGYGNIKPFECVGTYSEIRFAISKTINNLESKNEKLPYLLKFYKENYDCKIDDIILKFYNENNNLPKEFDNILRNKIFETLD